MVNSAAEAYKKQQVLTATPEALTLMLYNGCLKFIKEGVEALAEKKYEAANTSLHSPLGDFPLSIIISEKASSLSSIFFIFLCLIVSKAKSSLQLSPRKM